MLDGYRAGKGEADSSEGEDEEEVGQQSEHLIDTLLDAEDGNVQVDQQGNIVQPSLAFCQALDNEQEYDEIDAVAGTTLRGITDPAAIKPNRFTEVRVGHVLQCITGNQIKGHDWAYLTYATHAPTPQSLHTSGAN